MNYFSYQEPTLMTIVNGISTKSNENFFAVHITCNSSIDNTLRVHFIRKGGLEFRNLHKFPFINAK